MRHVDPQLPLRPAGNARFALVVSRFNEAITSRLLEGARAALVEAGASPDRIAVFTVPGAFELPQMARCAGETGQYEAIVCLGCVIRGETPHFEYISGEAVSGISSAMLQYKIPVAFGVLTTNTLEQAIERAGTKMGNKGFEAALTAIEMASLSKEIS